MQIPFQFCNQVGRVSELGIASSLPLTWRRTFNGGFDPSRCVTDWSTVIDFIEQYGGNDVSGFNSWVTRNSKREDWSQWFSIYKAFRHDFLYKITPTDIKNHVQYLAKFPEEHALGDVRPSEQTDLIKNISPTPPLVLSFHSLLESISRIPKFSEFWEFHLENHHFFMGSCLKAANLPVKPTKEMWDKHPDLRTIRYRLGNAYYSALKEINILSGLRHRNHLDVRYHFVIDLEWKADLFLDDLLIEIYVSNKNFKSSDRGRKIKSESRNPTRRVLPVEKEAGTRWGNAGFILIEKSMK